MRRLAWLALALSGCFGACEDHRTPEQKAEQRKWDQAVPALFRKRIATIVAATPDAAKLTERRCPAWPASAAPALAVDHEAVDYFTDKSWDEDLPERRMFRFMHADQLFHQLSASAGWGLTSQLVEVRARWYALIVSTARRAPQVGGGAAITGGWLDGWVVFFDEQGSGPLCAAPFHAESGDTIQRRGDKLKEAACRDLARQVGAAVDRAAARVGGPRVALGGEDQCWVMGER